MEYDLEQVLEDMKEYAVTAGEEIAEIYGRNEYSIDYKDDQSPLTIADTEADRIICDGLGKLYPDISILSEERVDDLSRLDNDWCFIVDPLDGTKEFVKRTGEFTVNIALSHKNRVVCGVVYVPVTKQLYYASKDNGAFLADSDGVFTKISVTDNTDNLIMVGSRSHGSDKMDELIEKYNIKEFRTAGSSLKGCMIADGRADIYYRFGLTMEWDTAAMQCIVEEAGGVFKQMDGSEMLYNRRNSLNEKGFFAVNRKENQFNL